MGSPIRNRTASIRLPPPSYCVTPKTFSPTIRKIRNPLEVDSVLCSADTRVVGAVVTLMDRGDGSRHAEQGSGAQEEGGLAMAKVLRCGDLMPGCNAVIEG